MHTRYSCFDGPYLSFDGPAITRPEKFSVLLMLVSSFIRKCEGEQVPTGELYLHEDFLLGALSPG